MSNDYGALIGQIDILLKTQIKASEDRFDTLLKTQIKASEDRIVNLVTTLVHSLEEKMDSRFDAMESRFDNHALRLDRQAGLIRTGQLWINRHSAWAERVDKALAVKDRQIGELSRRIEKLEEQ